MAPSGASAAERIRSIESSSREASASSLAQTFAKATIRCSRRTTATGPRAR
jgi:hypothetical protein